MKAQSGKGSSVHRCVQTALLVMILVVLVIRGFGSAEEPVLKPAPMTDQQQVDLVLEAMQIMAATENPGNLDALLARRGVNPRDLANSILANAKEAKIDPLLLVVMAWIETRFNPKAVSDFINRPQEGKNCGLLQVRTDIPGRPSCEKMMNADENLKWATAHLQELISGCGGELCLKKYNAGDYSDRVWRKLDWLQRKMQWRKV